TGRPLSPPVRAPAKVKNCGVSADGGRLFAVTTDGRLHVWETATGRPLPAPLPDPETLVQIVSLDGRRAVAQPSPSGGPGRDLTTGQRLPDLQLGGEPGQFHLNGPGTRAVTVSKKEGQSVVETWDVIACRRLARPAVLGEEVTGVVISEDDRRVLIATARRLL